MKEPKELFTFEISLTVKTARVSFGYISKCQLKLIFLISY